MDNIIKNLRLSTYIPKMRN